MNNNGYNNYNGYDAQQPVQPIVLTDAQYIPVDPGKKTANTLGIISIVCGLLSCCCFGLTGIAGIIMSIIGLKKNKGNILCIIGLAVSVVLLAYVVISYISVFTNPETMQQFTNAYQQALQQQASGMPSGLPSVTGMLH